MKLFTHLLVACSLTAALSAPLRAADKDTPKDDAKDTPPKMGSSGYMDSLDGFRGVKFGTDYSQFTGLTVEKDYGKLKTYTKTGEDLHFGMCHLQGIVYHFFDDKFYGVSLHTEGHEDTDTLLAIVATAFGKGSSSPDGTLFWEGKTDWAHFATHPATRQGSFFIGNLEISHNLGTFEQKAAIDAASQL